MRETDEDTTKSAVHLLWMIRDQSNHAKGVTIRKLSAMLGALEYRAPDAAGCADVRPSVAVLTEIRDLITGWTGGQSSAKCLWAIREILKDAKGCDDVKTDEDSDRETTIAEDNERYQEALRDISTSVHDWREAQGPLLEISDVLRGLDM